MTELSWRGEGQHHTRMIIEEGFSIRKGVFSSIIVQSFYYSSPFPSWLPMATSTDSNKLQLPDSFLSAPPKRGSTPGRQQGRIVVVAYDETRASDAILDRVIRTGLLEPNDDIHLVHILQQSDFFSSLTPKNLSSNLYHNMPAGYDMNVGRSSNGSDSDLVKNVKEDLLLAVADVLRKHSVRIGTNMAYLRYLT